MKILKVNREDCGVAFTSEGPLTDLYGDGNLINLDTGEILTWFDPVSKDIKFYHSYGKFSIAGKIHIALFETEAEYKNFSESFELFYRERRSEMHRHRRRGESPSVQHQAAEAKWRKAISEGKDISCYKCIHADEINECEACINCWCFSNYIERDKRVQYVVYHYECVPADFIMAFNTLEEACAYRDEYDFQDEWFVGELIED